MSKKTKGTVLFEKFLKGCPETQAAIARRLGVSEGHVTHLKNGAKGVSVVLAGKIQELSGGEVPAESWGRVL